MKIDYLKSKNGSYIAEAAVVLPVIIFAILTTVLIVMFFYEQSVEESKMHIALRCQAGQLTEKNIYYSEGFQKNPEGFWDGDVSVKRYGLYYSLSARENISMLHKGLIYAPGTTDINGSWYAIDPAKIRRQK